MLIIKQTISFIKEIEIENLLFIIKIQVKKKKLLLL